MNGSSLSDLPDVPELCSRLQREANAQVVLILGPDGEIVGHAGQPGRLSDQVVDGVADAAAEALQRAARAAEPQPGEPDDHLAQVGSAQICAAPLGAKAVLVVVFEDPASLSLVRMRMKRAREQILRSLETA